MFRFTIRELVLVTVIVALAAGWGISWFKLRYDLQNSRAAVDIWQDKALALAEIMRQAGWRAEVSAEVAGGGISVQAPTLDEYAELVEAKYKKALGRGAAVPSGAAH